MSQTFSLVCRETKCRVWLGQGWGKMETLYSGKQLTMEALKQFLNDHIGKQLEFVCDEADFDEAKYRKYDREAKLES